MPTERKNEAIKELQARVAASPNFFLTDYRGLTVSELRTLAHRAAQERRPNTRSSRTRSSAKR